jgi:hypothetical protein
VSTQATIILLISFVSGAAWTARFGWQLGAIVFASLLLVAVTFYFSLGLFPGFLEWMNTEGYTDPSIRVLIISGFVVVLFFLGTATKWIFDQLRRIDANDRSKN